MMTVFMLKSARYRDHDGRNQFGGQWQDVSMPLAIAERALRLGVAVPLTDPRRAELRGCRGDDYKPSASDVVDLDRGEEPKFVANADPILAEAGFTEIDRTSEARTLHISVPRA
jgi:hypothetical protein